MFKFLSKKNLAAAGESEIETFPDGEQIGAVAGEIWRLLDQNGETAMPDLIRQVGTSRDLVMQGIGWLARENKIHIDGQRQSISLIGDEQICAA